MNWIGGLSNVNGEFRNEDCAYPIEGVVVTGKKKTVQVEAIAETPVSSWGNLFGIGYLGIGSGGGSSGIGGNGGGWGSPSNGSMGGGGA